MNDETHDAMAGPYQDERNGRRGSISGELRPMNLMQDKLILVHAALQSSWQTSASRPTRLAIRWAETGYQQIDPLAVILRTEPAAAAKRGQSVQSCPEHLCQGVCVRLVRDR